MADKNIYTVVVADDEDELREAVCTMIPWEALGFHLVGNASNGLDALELVERLEPDLLLTDIRMPFISGIELARQVREIRPAMHIAFLSGFDDFEYAKQAIQYNIISYMLKPLTMDGLAAELKAIHEKIDARYAGLRRADSAHADRAALIIPLVLARYENAPENLETRLRQAAVDCGLLRGTDDRSTLVVMAAALDGPVDYEAGFTQLVEQSANKYLRHFVFYCCGRAVALLLGNPSDFDEYLHILADEICQLADRAKYGDQIEVVFCNNDDMAIGALQAIQAAGRTVNKDIYLVGVDALDAAKNEVANGNMTGTVLNDAKGQATQAVASMEELLGGKTFEAGSQSVYVDYVKVTPDNVKDFQ